MLKKFSLVFVLLFLVGSMNCALAFFPEVYEISVSYDSGNVALDRIKVVEAIPSPSFDQPAEGYVVKIISHDGEEYRDYTFNFHLVSLVTPGEECFDEDGNVDNVNLCPGFNSYNEETQDLAFFRLPFSPGAKYLRVYDPEGTLIIEKDISFLSCGNGVCEGHESNLGCFSDCSSESDFSLWIYVILGIIIVVVVILIARWRKNEKQTW